MQPNVTGQKPINQDIVQDLDAPLWGASAIAAAANLTRRQAFWRLEAGQIPARKVGRSWVTTLRQIRAAFEVVQTP